MTHNERSSTSPTERGYKCSRLTYRVAASDKTRIGGNKECDNFWKCRQWIKWLDKWCYNHLYFSNSYQTFRVVRHLPLNNYIATIEASYAWLWLLRGACSHNVSYAWVATETDFITSSISKSIKLTTNNTLSYSSGQCKVVVSLTLDFFESTTKSIINFNVITYDRWSIYSRYLNYVYCYSKFTWCLISWWGNGRGIWKTS